MKKVTTFREFKIKKMDELLAEAARLVASGEATGVFVSLKTGDCQHDIGILGDYLEDPSLIHALTPRVDYLVNQLIDKRLRKLASAGGGVAPFGRKK